MRYNSFYINPQKLKRLRLQAGMSQQELAEKINVSDQTISHWETERHCPQPDSFRRLAKALNVPIKELVIDQMSYDYNDNPSTSTSEINVVADSNDVDVVDVADSDDVVLAKKVSDRLKFNRSMIDELLERYHLAYSLGQFDCSISLYEPFLDDLKLETPMSIVDVCRIILQQAQTIAADSDFTKESTDVIHWIGNVIYSQPRDIFTTLIDCERIWTNIINIAHCVVFPDSNTTQRYFQLIDNLTPSRFALPEARVEALLRLFFFYDENWKSCQNQPDAYEVLSLIFCLFEQPPIDENDLLNLNRAATVIFIFLYALDKANLRKPHPIVKDE